METRDTSVAKSVLPVNPEMPARQVSSVTVVYHTGPILWQCIDSLLLQPELTELILVVNGADTATRAGLQEYAARESRIRLVDVGRNIGFAAGCNLGATAATADWLAFVNPDCVLARGTIGAILDVFQAQPGAWLVGGHLQHPDGREQRGGRREVLTPWRAFIEVSRLDRVFPNHPYFARLNHYEDEPEHEAVRVPTVSGAFMVVSRAHYERLGGMDDNMFLHFDDLDLCIRIQQQGGEVWYAGHVPVTHHLSTSDVSRIFVEWHKARSSSYYFIKHFQHSYPRWSLSGISLLLWLRFALLAVRYLPGDLPKSLARWLRHHRKS